MGKYSQHFLKLGFGSGPLGPWASNQAHPQTPAQNYRYRHRCRQFPVELRVVMHIVQSFQFNVCIQDRCRRRVQHRGFQVGVGWKRSG